MQEADRDGWDAFARTQEVACLYQLAAWKDVIARSYSHPTQYIVARKSLAHHHDSSAKRTAPRDGDAAAEGNPVVGILPMAHVQHWLFGNRLVSLPYWDAAGVLASTPAVERMLVEHGLRVADALSVPAVEFRQYRPLQCIDDTAFAGEPLPSGHREIHAARGWRVCLARDSNKVRMVLDLPDSADALMRSFKAKLRSQIRKPLKDGLVVRIDGADLIDDFYKVFAENMRDLGSPVHSKRIIRETLLSFPDNARIFVVYGHGVPMACSLTLAFNGILSNPWASSLRQYSKDAPNMLLYWSMLEHACSQQCRKFDFGRSTIDEGTYRFKCQWGALPQPLYWYRFSRDVHADRPIRTPRISRLIEYWKMLPVPVTRVLGPKIRRYISL